ncbi:hypothetical protein CBR_g31483 [Chara braunii]|uniref:Reverse transcriptase/retrotransposon-derived protein RNase H-like domain-containing protein n=1 Tax=Chara braunii TaxID=69332 RepID=A0A388LF90_CHABU|nr:hypothetical protein CBR_g31483 [Chara braunii]|eukprot:GBG80927.1 hypothetical protein CBR_g31483 [Chara braunii]
MIPDESIDLHAAPASSSDGVVAALPAKRPKRVRKNKATQATTSTGTGQQPWTTYNITKEVRRLPLVQKYAVSTAKAQQEAAEAERQRLANQAAAQAQRTAEADATASDRQNAASTKSLILNESQWTALLQGMIFVPTDEQADPTPAEAERSNLANLMLGMMWVVRWNNTMLQAHLLADRLLRQKQQQDTVALTVVVLATAVQQQKQHQLLNTMITHVNSIEAKASTAPGCTTNTAKQLRERIDHVVNIIGELGDFTSPATISSTVAAIKTDITKLQSRPEATAKIYTMPRFNINKYDDYNKTDALQWWQAFLTEAACHHVPDEDMMKALYLQLIGGAQAWMNHTTANLGCTIAQLHTHITWKQFEQIWNTRFMVCNVVKAAMNEAHLLVDRPLRRKQQQDIAALTAVVRATVTQQQKQHQLLNTTISRVNNINAKASAAASCTTDTAKLLGERIDHVVNIIGDLVMTTEFRDLLDRTVLIYLHDILVYSRTLDEHLVHLLVVLDRLRAAKYKANRDKCEFAKQELGYLWYYMTLKGICPLADKIQAIVDWSEPRWTADVRSFMGLAGYYQRFVESYSKVAAPLSRLQSPKVRFEFDDAARGAFNMLKAAMQDAPALRIYDPTLPTQVTMDASRYGIGAVLEQCHTDAWHPVEYFSQKVPPINTLGDARKKELLAFVTVLKRWRHFLLGRWRFRWNTDNNPLTFYKTQNTVTSTIGRWMYYIHKFDFEPFHIPGPANRAADTLSQRPDLCALVTTTFQLDDDLQQHFVKGYKSDPTYSTLYAELSSDHPPDGHYLEEKAARKTRNSSKKTKMKYSDPRSNTKSRRGANTRKGRDETSEDTDTGTNTGDDTTDSSTTTTSESNDQEARQRSRTRRKKKRTTRRSKRSKGKGRVKENNTPSRVYEKGECSGQQRNPRRINEHMHMKDDTETEAEPRTPLTGGFKGLAAGCSQKGLIEYCISAHKIYSSKKADVLKKLCDQKGIKYTKKPEAVELLARHQVELAYDGYEEDRQTTKEMTKTKASGSPRKEFSKDRTTTEKKMQKAVPVIIRAMLTAWLRRPKSDSRLVTLTTRKLIGLYKTVGLFTEKQTKHRLQSKLDRVIVRKTEVSVRKRVNVKIPFDSRLRRNGIRQVTERLIENMEGDRALTDFLKTRIRIVWTRNRNVAELLHNQKRFACEDEHPCLCRTTDLPKYEGHVLTRRKMEGYVSLSLETIMEGVKYDLRHSIVRCGDKIVKQVFGIPMGKATSPILASITCAMAEMWFIRELGSDRRLIGGWRIMDDITIIVGMAHRISNTEYPENLFEDFESIYDKNLEVIRKDECGVAWDFVGGSVMICQSPLQLHFVPSTKNTESLYKEGKLVFQTMQNYSSYSAKSAKKVVLTTTIKRLWDQTTSKELVLGAIGFAICEANLWGYPPEVSLGALANLAKAVPNKALRHMYSALEDTTDCNRKDKCRIKDSVGHK